MALTTDFLNVICRSTLQNRDPVRQLAQLRFSLPAELDGKGSIGPPMSDLLGREALIDMTLMGCGRMGFIGRHDGLDRARERVFLADLPGQHDRIEGAFQCRCQAMRLKSCGALTGCDGGGPGQAAGVGQEGPAGFLPQGTLNPFTPLCWTCVLRVLSAVVCGVHGGALAAKIRCGNGGAIGVSLFAWTLCARDKQTHIRGRRCACSQTRKKEERKSHRHGDVFECGLILSPGRIPGRGGGVRGAAPIPRLPSRTMAPD